MKKLIALLCAVVMLLSGCAVISEPAAGGDAADVFNGYDFEKPQQLLKSGTPIACALTNPNNFLTDVKLYVNGALTDTFERTDKIDIYSNYTELEGVITFRGDNFRSSAAYGTANITEKKFDSAMWSIETGKLQKTYGDGYWSGSGWTGQPIIIRWDAETKAAMNIYDNKKNKDGLTEVIYATMDGNIYFLDIDDGSYTRDPINLGFPIKGTGSLHPGGVPLYFVGAGDSMGEDCARTFVVDLISGKIVYEYGMDDEVSPRKDNDSFTAFDSSPLIDVETDTLIQPGENGVLYTTKLNTKYDGKSLSIAPSDIVKWTYTTTRSGEETYWLGMESSAVIWHGYMYICDNCGDLICIDLNTMQPVWVQDILDDSNATPVLEEDEKTGTAYIYVSTSLHWTQDSSAKGNIPLYKINAATGEIIWQRDYECQTVSGVSGGVQATALVGKESLSNYVYFAVARTGGKDKGKIVCIDKGSGAEVWSCEMKNYTWSSPVAVYDASGTGYVILCDSDGNMFLMDGATGEMYDKINLGGSNIESSPAVFENTIVVGTRGQKIYGIMLK